MPVSNAEYLAQKDREEAGRVERGISETMAKVPGGGWDSPEEKQADVEMWLRALSGGGMYTE